MKIVLINNLYKPYARGGAERVAETIANELVRQKHEVIIIASKPLFGKKIIFNIKYLILNTYFFNIISYYNLGKLPKIFRPFWHLINIFNLHGYFKVKGILKREQPDLVMTHNLMGVGFLMLQAIRACNVKHIHTLHDIQLLHPSGLINVKEEQKIDNVFARIYQLINKKLFSKVDVVVSPSEWLMKMHKDRGFFSKAKCKVTRNPISSVIASEQSERSNLVKDGIAASLPSVAPRNDNFVFLYVGQIEKHKGVGLLVKAFQQLNNNCELQIVGEGKEIKNYKLLITNYESHRIKFLGRKTPDEIQKLMQEADCLVVPSLCYENQPTVIIEAMQDKLPVIASNIGGIPELVDEKFLFKAGDRDSLTEKMRWIVKSKNELHNLDLRLKVKDISAERYVDDIFKL